MFELKIREDREFRYISEGEGPVILFLHGLFGALSNFTETVKYFSNRYRVVIPVLPLYELELDRSTVMGLVDHLSAFIEHKKLDRIHLIGNSLGGHIGLLYTLAHRQKVATLTLTGSSGLFESSLGDTYPRKGDLEYVKKKTEATFYDPAVATPELVQSVYETVNNRDRAIRIVLIAKSAIRHNMRDELHHIQIPVNLIWGKNDTITPPYVGEEFQKLIPDATLSLIDRCGHAPMMERPDEFNRLMDQFLTKNLHQ